MTALAADAERHSRGGGRAVSYPVAASTDIFKGGLVAIDGDGFAIPAEDTAARPVVGVAEHRADNNPGADGDINVKVRSGRSFLFAATSITQIMVGDIMVVVDDNTIDDIAGATADISVGRLEEFVSTTSGWVFIPEGGGQDVA